MTWRTAQSTGAPVGVRVWQAGWQGAVRRRGMLGANYLVARAEAVCCACALFNWWRVKSISSVSASHGEGERGRCSSSAPFFKDWQVISSHFGPPQARNHKPTCHPSHFMYLLTCRSSPLCFRVFTSSTALRGAACPTPAPTNLQAIPTTARHSLLDCATQPVDSSAPCSAVDICHVPHNVWSH